MKSNPENTGDMNPSEPDGLTEQANLLKKSIQFAPYPAMIHAEGGDVLLVNDCWTEITGYRVEDIPTIATWIKKAYGKRAPIVNKDINRLYQMQGRVDEGEYTILTRSGKQRIWDFSSAVLGNLPDGRRVVISMAKDVTETLELRGALKQSELRFETIANNIPNGIIHIFDEDFCYVYSAGKNLADLGLTNEYLIGKSIFDILPGETARMVSAQYSKVLKGHTVTFSDAFGGRYFIMHSAPMRNAAGAITHILTLSTDITEMKKVEQVLKHEGETLEVDLSVKTEKLYREKEQLRVTLGAIGDGVIATDVEGNVTFINKAALNLTGHSEKNAIGRPLSEVFHIINSRTRKPCPNPVDTALKRGRKVELANHTVLISRTGQEYIIADSGSPIRSRDGEILGVILVFRDNTKKHKLERSLIENENRYRQLFEKIKDTVYFTSLNGDIKHLNQAGLKLLGIKKGELPSLKTKEFYINPEDQHNFMETVRKKGWIKNQPVKLKAKNGRILSCLDTATTWEDSSGNIIGFKGFLKDMTEWQRMQDELHIALNRAQRTEQVKSHFLANISHEIRTPLNAISGFTDIIKAKLDTVFDEETAGFFNIIQTSSDRLLKSVHKILDIADIKSQSVKLDTKGFDLVKQIKKIISDLENQATRKHLKLNLKTGLATAWIRADQSHVNAAVFHLIENAIKFTEQGGIEITLKPEKKKYCLTIKDTGVGISGDYLNNIYEIFSQESTGFNKGYQGLGLGLSLTKSYLDLNDIDIQVSSNKGVGTSFTLTFRALAQRADKSTDQVPLKKPGGKTGKMNVLVVEDDQFSQLLLESFLKDVGTVHCATSVSEAQKTLKAEDIDLMLLDLSLDGNEDGLALARYVRRHPEKKELPIFAVTAHASATVRQSALRAGCQEFIDKPVNSTRLFDKINKYVSIEQDMAS